MHSLFFECYFTNSYQNLSGMKSIWIGIENWIQVLVSGTKVPRFLHFFSSFDIMDSPRIRGKIFDVTFSLSSVLAISTLSQIWNNLAAHNFFLSSKWCKRMQSDAKCSLIYLVKKFHVILQPAHAGGTNQGAKFNDGLKLFLNLREILIFNSSFFSRFSQWIQLQQHFLFSYLLAGSK